jgi:hypothetical protein
MQKAIMSRDMFHDPHEYEAMFHDMFVLRIMFVSRYVSVSIGMFVP